MSGSRGSPQAVTVSRRAAAIGVGGYLAPRIARESIAPPLQADLARQRLAGKLAHARDFAVEGIERIEMPPPLRRRKQRGEEPVLVGGAHHRLAMGIGILHEATISGTAR